MTTKHLSGYYADGYTLSAGYDRLVIDKTANIRGDGVEAVGFATVVNRGSVYGSNRGVYLAAGGSLINGSAIDTSASITGYQIGVRTLGAAAVVNFGTIAALGGYGDGVVLADGGSLTNGSVRQTTALISGYFGVFADADATIANFGTTAASGYGGSGVFMLEGGSLTNGSSLDHIALIRGAFGVGVDSVATIANFGTIDAFGHNGDGVFMLAGGSLTNGSFADNQALISGELGVGAYGVATIANFGTITSDEGRGNGVALNGGGLLTNGSAHDTAASIYGAFGVSAADAATVVNFGTIGGLSGVSVKLVDASGELIAEAGSTFIGAIEGGGGRLALAGGGSGTISSLGAAGKLTGAIDAYFSGFGSYEVAAGGAWALAGANTLNAGSVLLDEGRLVNRGALTLAGTLSIASSGVLQLAAGNVLGGPSDVTRIVDDGLMIKNAGVGTITVGARTIDDGVVEVATGTLDFTSHLLGTGVLQIDGGATLEVDAAAVSTLSATFDGAAATLALKIPNAFLATIGGLAIGDTIDLLTLTATGASVNANDQLVVVNGAKTVATLQLSGNYAGAAFAAVADGHGGTNVKLASVGGARLPSVYELATLMAPSAKPAGGTGAVAPPHSFIAAMAGFRGMEAAHLVPTEAWAAREPLLSAPRVAIA